jgi:TonB family protein
MKPPSSPPGSGTEPHIFSAPSLDRLKTEPDLAVVAFPPAGAAVGVPADPAVALAGDRPEDKPRASPEIPRSPRTRTVLALVTVGAAGLIGAGAWALRRGADSRSRPPAAAVALPPLPTQSSEADRSPPTSEPPSPPGPSKRAPPPPKKTAVAKAGEKREPLPSSRPLTTREAAITFGRARAKILDCFEQFSDSVSKDEGEIMVSVVVAQSGAVREASISSAPVGSPALNQCIVDRAKKLQFRSHPDKELRINVPFVYRVRN